ncbi:putative transcriptional regulatory protein pdtaR [compost metagenome]
MQDELREARQALEERKLIERAKQLLIRQQGCNESEAYAWLRQAAMNQGLQLEEVAQRLLAASAESPAQQPRARLKH